MSEYVPDSLEKWNYETVNALVSSNCFETDAFDFKEMLVNKPDPKHNLRICKTAAAFANSSGGFIIFGVKDWEEKLSSRERIVGLEYDSELAQYFGNAVSASEPSISYVPGNPPIKITNSSKVIFVVKIPISTKGPHGVLEDGRLHFYKRTNKGNEPMSHAEIRTAFFSHHERDRKLRLLLRTLADYLFAIPYLKSPAPVNGTARIYMSDLNCGILDMLISDLYVLLPTDDKDLWPNLRNIRTQAQTINQLMNLFRMRYYGGILPATEIVDKYNKEIDSVIPGFVETVQKVMSQLSQHGDIGGVTD